MSDKDPFDLSAAELAEELAVMIDGHSALSAGVTTAGNVLAVETVRPDGTPGRTYRVEVTRL